MPQKQRWAKDPLATVPPTKTMGPEDRQPLLFNAQGEDQTVSLSSADVTLFELLDDGADSEAIGPIMAFQVSSPHVTVLLEGLTLNKNYLCSVTMQSADGRRWTRNLTVFCRRTAARYRT